VQEVRQGLLPGEALRQGEALSLNCRSSSQTGARPAARPALRPAPEGKTVKNRLHLDFRRDDRDAEVERFLALDARHTDVGQRGNEPWVVLADPDGNEFCVLGERSGG